APEDRAGKGLACVDGEGRVVAFEEKPHEPSCDRPAAAIYAFAPELPEWIDAYLEEGGNPDAPGHFLEWFVARGTPVAAYPIPGYRFDIGTPERYEEARGFFGD
ncbi:MAG: NDP-sugar synthase, partial [Gemmatimonadetes bacterium]|nr:NDP-sugar synthase [Gemmatimonadota bacterium]NIR80349.1 NDP-sugar synthase [Gemmatimonadota bacterium]NIT89112.1 NDP-sugar synthase [Gemmatimonadota bacterium]NIU32909.1 NDP-sugar synthase [Gemmatimonadota bacterium]NIU37308.1 NDP-sugar synthase [Gemmatimonadota bacterium]